MAASIADAFLPDLVRFDAANPDGFPNGRRLTDDVIDLELAQWTNGRVTTACVGSDSAFSNAFPYLAPANPSREMDVGGSDAREPESRGAGPSHGRESSLRGSRE